MMDNESAQQWVCNRKKAYPTQEMADTIARRIMNRDPTANLVGYGCRRCGRYHIGRRLSEG